MLLTAQTGVAAAVRPEPVEGLPFASPSVSSPASTSSARTVSKAVHGELVEPLSLGAGHSVPFGAQVNAGGVNFAVFSEHATRIELCIFDSLGNNELQRMDLYGPSDYVFHGQLSGVSAGLVYGFRAHGPYAPQLGHRFNPDCVLLDPYAREVIGAAGALRARVAASSGNHALRALVLPCRLPARLVLPYRLPARLVCRVAGARLKRGAHDVVLYELHVKGFSKTLATLPEAMRGTYAGLAHPHAIAHFKALGVTTLCLLPVQHALSEAHLVAQNRANYWGYNSIAFFAPEPRWGANHSDPSRLNAEFRDMVDALHAADLEVVLDVVFNHSAEGDQDGATISFRGLDNASYYLAPSDDLARTTNFTGCGNTLNIAHPRVTQWVLDCLRYWVSEMGVDGFRFDLATVLGREPNGYSKTAAFFTALRQDPVLAHVRLIAEPWDCGPNGYQLGQFPGRFIEWNDRFRDAMRSYWLGKTITRAEFARRFCGSSDYFKHSGKSATASVNFITAHDGFTLADLVSFSGKRNDANGEANRDGRDDELCANFGVEGATSDAEICTNRSRVRHALLASLLLSQGTPMLLAGDEIANSQHGNNNAYCQDNASAWLDWENADIDTVNLVRKLISLRANYPLLRHPHWFAAELSEIASARVLWRTPHGDPMTLQDWHLPIGVQAADGGLSAEYFAANANAASLCILFNPSARPQMFTLSGSDWQQLFDSSNANASAGASSAAQSVVNAPARALILLARAATSSNSRSSND